MIEPEFLRLERAAEMLGIESDTLLVAAFEERFRIYGLLNETIEAEFGDYNEEFEDGEPAWTGREFSTRRFGYVPLSAASVGQIIRAGRADLSGQVLSDHDARGGVWRDVRNETRTRQPLEVFRDHLFVRREVLSQPPEGRPVEDDDSLAACGERTSEGSGPVEGAGAARTSGQTKKRDSLLVIIAALGKACEIDTGGRGAAPRIKRLIDELGATLDEGTIRRILEEIPEAVDRRSKD